MLTDVQSDLRQANSMTKFENTKILKTSRVFIHFTLKFQVFSAHVVVSLDTSYAPSLVVRKIRRFKSFLTDIPNGR